MEKITSETNFCRVFELPNMYPKGFCFQGGKPVSFELVDWFNPIPAEDIHGNTVKTWGEYVDRLKNSLKTKNYLKPNRKYLLITDFDESFVFEK
jgi:hypothetical protein